MSLYDSARPVASVTYRELLVRKFLAAAEMLGMKDAVLPTYTNDLGRAVNKLESRCIKQLDVKRERCPLCGEPMKAGFRPVVDPPFIALSCWNRECESNKGRRQEQESENRRGMSWGT